LLNIGTPDAKRLDLKKTLAGEVVDVSDDAGDELIKHGWATDRLEEDKDKATPAAPAPSARPVSSAELHDEPRGPGNQSSAVPTSVTDKKGAAK
jgi:hypothetical protein